MGNDDIVIQVRQWQVTEKKMAPPKEILISKQATTDSMIHVLSTKFANLLLSDSDGLMFAKGTSFGPPLTAKSAHKLKWQEVSLSQADEGGGSTNPAAAAAVVARPPLSLRDGSILVLRSRQDYARAKEIAQEAKQAAGPKSAQKAAGAGRRRVTPFRPVERELRIHVATAGAGASPGGGELRIGGRDTAAGTAGEEELLPPGSPPDAVVAAPSVAPPTELQFEQ
uniref:Uncharacterized protein n=2 Tax=Heterosigma akashiwo TaxID=2829 RepID=A0A7S3UTD9_HETAK